MYLVYPPSSRGSIPQCMSAATQYLVVNLFSGKEVDWFTFMCSQVWLDCWQIEMKVLPLEKDFSQFSILDLHKADHSIPANLGPWQFQISVDLSSISADWRWWGRIPAITGRSMIVSPPIQARVSPAQAGYLTPFLILAKKNAKSHSSSNKLVRYLDKKNMWPII